MDNTEKYKDKYWGFFNVEDCIKYMDKLDDETINRITRTDANKLLEEILLTAFVTVSSTGSDTINIQDSPVVKKFLTKEELYKTVAEHNIEVPVYRLLLSKQTHNNRIFSPAIDKADIKYAVKAISARWAGIAAERTREAMQGNQKKG